MRNASTTTPADELAISMQILKVTRTANALYVIGGLLASATSLVSLATVLGGRSAAKPFHSLIASMSAVDSLMGVTYLFTGLKRLTRDLSAHGEVISHWQCCLETFLLYFCQTCILYLAAALTFDRMVGTFCPISYKCVSFRKFTLPLLLLSLSLSTSECLSMMWQTAHHVPPVRLQSCGTASCWQTEGYVLALYSHIGISVLITCSNALILVKVRRQIRKAAKQALSSRAVKHVRKRLQVKASYTLTVMVVSHLLSHFCGRVGLAVMMVWTSRPDETALGQYLRNLVVFKGAAHFFIYYYTSSEFHQAVRLRAVRLIDPCTSDKRSSQATSAEKSGDSNSNKRTASKTDNLRRSNSFAHIPLRAVATSD